jgi:hypothetical protein
MEENEVLQITASDANKLYTYTIASILEINREDR